MNVLLGSAVLLPDPPAIRVGDYTLTWIASGSATINAYLT
jgi:hypothetical protein